jgi:S1-C subfamily serine protease
MLTDEWSVGRYLDTILLPASEGGRRYIINPILGGIHSGCSGAPVFNALGQVVGIVLSHNNSGSVLTTFTTPLSDLKQCLSAAGKLE